MRNTSPVDDVRRGGIYAQIDFALFSLLFCATLSFEFQPLMPAVGPVSARHILIAGLAAYLYAQLLATTRRWDGGLSVAVISFFVLCAAAAAYTAVLYDSRLAFSGFVRFVNVAILAPLAAHYVTDGRQLRILLIIWSFVIAIGFCTALFQLSGGEMEWLVGDYYSGRGDHGSVLRYKTILGEPNVGGMAAVIVMVAATLLLGGLSRIAVILLSVSFVVLSLSKAAAGLLFLAAAALGVMFWTSPRRRTASMRWLYVSAAAAATVTCIAIYAVPVARDYAITLFKSVVAAGGYGMSQGISGALSDRVYSRVVEGFSHIIASGLDPLLASIFGTGFGIAGSVAVSVRGEAVAFLPHNGYLEIFMVGGAILLVTFLWMVGKTWLALFRSARRRTPMAVFLSLTFTLFVLMLIGYPVMYQPVLGSLFWLIVGVAADPDRLESVLADTQGASV